MIAKSIDLISPLPRDDCVRRLQDMTSYDYDWFASGKPLIGYVEETSLRLRKRNFYRNPFQCSLFASLVEEDGRTRLRCRLGVHPFVAGFMVLWFAFVLLICGMTFVAMLVRPTAAPPWGFLYPLAFGIIFVVIGGFCARNEEDFVVELVRQAIDAREV